MRNFLSHCPTSADFLAIITQASGLNDSEVQTAADVLSSEFRDTRPANHYLIRNRRLSVPMSDRTTSKQPIRGVIKYSVRLHVCTAYFSPDDQQML